MDGASSGDVLRIGFVRLSAHRAIYGTVIVMAALAAFEGSGDVSQFDVIGVVLAPLVALAAAHTFSDVADRQIAVQRPLAWADWRSVIAANLQFVYVAIPPLMVLLSALSEGWDVDDTVGLLLLLGMVSLVLWGWYAGRRAGLSRGWIVITSVGYGAIGLGVLILELVLAAH